MKIVINNLRTDRDDLEYITQPLLVFINSYLPKASHRETLPSGDRMTAIFENFEDYVEVTCYYEIEPGHMGGIE